MYIYISYMFML